MQLRSQFAGGIQLAGKTIAKEAVVVEKEIIKDFTVVEKEIVKDVKLAEKEIVKDVSPDGIQTRVGYLRFGILAPLGCWC